MTDGREARPRFGDFEAILGQLEQGRVVVHVDQMNRAMHDGGQRAGLTVVRGDDVELVRRGGLAIQWTDQLQFTCGGVQSEDVRLIGVVEEAIFNLTVRRVLFVQVDGVKVHEIRVDRYVLRDVQRVDVLVELGRVVVLVENQQREIQRAREGRHAVVVRFDEDLVLRLFLAIERALSEDEKRFVVQQFLDRNRPVALQ